MPHPDIFLLLSEDNNHMFHHKVWLLRSSYLPRYHFLSSLSLLLTPIDILGLPVEQGLQNVAAHQADLLRLLLRVRRQRRHLRHHNLAVSGQDGGCRRGVRVRERRLAGGVVVLRLHLWRRKGGSGLSH